MRGWNQTMHVYIDYHGPWGTNMLQCYGQGKRVLCSMLIEAVMSRTNRVTAQLLNIDSDLICPDFWLNVFWHTCTRCASDGGLIVDKTLSASSCSQGAAYLDEMLHACGGVNYNLRCKTKENEFESTCLKDPDDFVWTRIVSDDGKVWVRRTCTAP